MEPLLSIPLIMRKFLKCVSNGFCCVILGKTPLHKDNLSLERKPRAAMCTSPDYQPM